MLQWLPLLLLYLAGALLRDATAHAERAFTKIFGGFPFTQHARSPAYKAFAHEVRHADILLILKPHAAIGPAAPASLPASSSLDGRLELLLPQLLSELSHSVAASRGELIGIPACWKSSVVLLHSE